MPDSSGGQKLGSYPLGAHQISKQCAYEYPMELIFSLKHFLPCARFQARSYSDGG